MHLRSTSIRLVLTVAAALSPLAVMGDSAPVELEGPEVYKLDWNTRALRHHDIDGDGRTDLLLLNNATTKLEILYQRPPGKVEKAARRTGSMDRWKPRLEDARFRRKSLVTGISMYDLAAGDLNRDGRPDLAITGDPDGLTILYQGNEDDWPGKHVFRDISPAKWASTLAINDVDGDGRQELIVLAQREALIFGQDEEGRFGTPQHYPLSEEGCYGLLVEPIDDDDLPDLIYLVPRSEDSWRVRFQREGGGFGPERAFRVPTPRRFASPIRIDGDRAFVSVHPRTGLIELMALRKPATGAVTEEALATRVYSTPTTDNTAANFALGDFDGDDAVDLALGDRRGAQVWLYMQEKSGTFGTPIAFPSLSDIRALTAGDVDGDGKAELFVVSQSEKLIGVSRMEPGGRLTYPRPVVAEANPLGATVVDIDGDRRLELAYLDRNDRSRSVVILEPDDDAAATWRESQRIGLTDLKTDPMAIEALDADQDGRTDLAVFTLQDPLRLLRRSDDDGLFVEVSASGAFRSGLVDGLLPVNLSSGDVTGDGRREMLVAGKGYARALRLAADGTLEVVDQFNAADSEAAVTSTFVADGDGAGVPEILLVQEENDEIALLRRDRGGVFRQRASIPIAPIQLVDTRVLDIAGDGVEDLLFLGKDRFWTAPVGVVDFEVRTLGSHEPDLDELVYVELATGDLNGDGVDDLVALDSRQTHILQVLVRDGENGWESALHFTVFEDDPHYQGRPGASSEPREMLVADLTSDGKPDIALLVHDRILVYPSR